MLMNFLQKLITGCYKNVCWGIYFCFIPGPKIDPALAYSALEPPVLKIGDLITACDEMLNAARFKEGEEIRPWGHFQDVGKLPICL